MEKCVLCGAKATINVQEKASRIIYNCQNCGVFVLSDLVVGEAKEHRNKLAAYFTNRRLTGCSEVVLVSFDKAKKDKDYLQLTVEQILDQTPQTFSEKMDMVLLNLTFLSAYEGAEIKVEDLGMYPVFYLKESNYDALSFVIKSMQKRNLIEVNYYGGSFFPCGVIVSPLGWDRVSRLQNGLTGASNAALFFPGNRDESEVFSRAARKAARECGYNVVESTLAGGDGRLGLETIAMVKSSRFFVADMTGGDPAAYFAAGMATVLGKPGILTCREDARSRLELDTDQIRVLGWKDEGELYLQILNAIRALME